MSTRKTRPVLVVVLACVAIITSPRAQESGSPPAGSRRVVRTGLPAIDRGLRSDSLAFATPPLGTPQGATDGRSYVRGRVIVTYRSGFSPAALAAVTSAVGAAPARPLSYANFSVLDIDESADPEALAAWLNTRPEVEYAQAAYRMELYWTPNDPMYGFQWNLPAIGMERAWDINPGASSEVVVAVLDSGVAFEDMVLRFNTRPIIVRFPDGTRSAWNTAR